MNISIFDRLIVNGSADAGSNDFGFHFVNAMLWVCFECGNDPRAGFKVDEHAVFFK